MGKLLCLMFVLLNLVGIYVLLALNAKSNNSTLKLVHALFRHGERSPSISYKNDPHKDHIWPGGWDQLSKRGNLEEYHLGISLRIRYEHFLPKIYHQQDILIESSYADRCIMSAQLVLAGLYPPEKDQIWNDHLLWQPIPVHSIPRFIDNKIAIKKDCKKHSKELANVYATGRLKNITVSNKEIFDYLTLHTGQSVASLRELETIYNTLEIEQLNGLTLPDWTKSVFPDKMKDLAALGLASFSETEPMKRMHGGVLVKEILEHMNDKQAKKLNPDRLIFLYSGHDLTVVSLLRALGFEELIKPQFGASVILELHEIGGEYIIKFFYKKNPYDKPDELIHENCKPHCKLENLNNILKPVLPEDWENDCLK